MGVSRKQSMPNFPLNEHFLPPDMHNYVCVSGGKKCSFFGKFDVVCFLETPFVRFALFPYNRRLSFQILNVKENTPLLCFKNSVLQLTYYPFLYILI